MNLQEQDAAAAAVATEPRISLADLEARVVERHDFTAAAALRGLGETPSAALETMSCCILVLDNGWKVIGSSNPAAAANFDPVLGKQLAYDQAIRQLWPMEAYLLRERLSVAESYDPPRGLDAPGA